jgi:hypothetical protein
MLSFHAMAMSKFSKSSAALPPSVCEIPPPFVPNVKKIDKVDGSDAEKSEWIKLEFLMDPDNRLAAPSTLDSLLSSRMDAQCLKKWIKWLPPSVRLRT